jgi:hypothetical protein
VARDSQDFLRYQQEYKRLAADPERRALVESSEPLYREYLKVGEDLMEMRDRQERLYHRVSAELEHGSEMARQVLALDPRGAIDARREAALRLIQSATAEASSALLG